MILLLGRPAIVELTPESDKRTRHNKRKKKHSITLNQNWLLCQTLSLCAHTLVPSAKLLRQIYYFKKTNWNSTRECDRIRVRKILGILIGIWESHPFGTRFNIKFYPNLLVRSEFRISEYLRIWVSKNVL